MRARVRAIADGPGSAEHKLDSWVSAIVEEAAARPWFPPIMLRELAARAPHFDATTFHMMNAVLAGVTDVIAQGKREGAFRDVDPLLAHLSIMPPVLIFFARQRVLAGRKLRGGLAEPRQLDQFVRHMQASVQRHAPEDIMTVSRLLVLAVPALLVACAPAPPSDRLRVSGHVEATEVHTAAEVSGRIVELRVDEGDRIEAGAVIARLDTEDTMLQIARTRADRATAVAQLRLLEAGSRVEDIRQAVRRWTPPRRMPQPSRPR